MIQEYEHLLPLLENIWHALTEIYELMSFVDRLKQDLPMRATHLFGYHIEYTDTGDVGHDASALIAPSDRVQYTGQLFFFW